MRGFLIILGALIAGPLVAWALAAGACSLPVVYDSGWCGHNAPYMLAFIVVPAILVVWYLLTRFVGHPASRAAVKRT